MSPLRNRLRRSKRRRERRPPHPLPRERQDAAVELGGGQSFDARVTRVEGEQIVLVLLLEAGDEVRPEGEVAGAALEFATPRGLVRLEGDAILSGRDVVRFRLAGAVETLQRRDFVRVRAVRPLSLAPIDESGCAGPWIDTLTADLSGNGMLIGGPDTLEAGSAVRFRVRLAAGEPPIEGEARVARANDAGQRGIMIEQLSDDARGRLVAFIFERERIARRRTRDGEL